MCVHIKFKSFVIAKSHFLIDLKCIQHSWTTFIESLNIIFEVYKYTSGILQWKKKTTRWNSPQNGIPSGSHSPEDSHTLLAGPKSSNPLSQLYVAIEPTGKDSLENDTVECAGAPGNLQRESDKAAQHPINPAKPKKNIIIHIIPNELFFVLSQVNNYSFCTYLTNKSLIFPKTY